jgi:predicted nucleic acid-binding protein
MAGETEATDASEVLEIRSDDLTHLRPLLRSGPEEAEVAEEQGWGFQVVVIPDANRIIKDLIWLADRRETEEARTRFQEVIDAETVIAVAPPYLKTEMKRKIPDVAERAEIPEEELWEQWESYEPRIDFREPSLEARDLATEVVDVKDVPYVALQREIEAPILSEDGDISAMGGAVVKEKTVQELREYARADSVRLTVIVHSSVAIELGVGAVKGGFKLLRSLYLAFRSLPPLAQLSIGAGAAYVLSLERVQDRMQSAFGSVREGGKKVFRVLTQDVLLPLAEEMTEAEREADRRLKRVRKQLPPPPSRHIKRHVRRWSDHDHAIVRS